MTGVVVALVAALSLGVGAALQPVVAEGTSYLTQTFRIGAATPYNLTWPEDDGAADGVLQTDGSGALTWATDLDVAGGLDAGSGDVALVGTDGKLNGPLRSTIIDNLSGVNLTSLNASNLGSGTMPMARMPDNVLVDQAFDTDSTYTSSATTTWVDTGLSLTITVNNATNDVVLMAWQHVSASGGNAFCQIRLVKGTTELAIATAGDDDEQYKAMLAHRDANPGAGATTYKTQLRRNGTANTCSSENSSKQSVLWAYEVQD